MTERIEKLISCIPQVNTFADIGCDHGYCSKGVLERGLAKKVYIADISDNCLQKAKQLLKTYIDNKSVFSFVTDGLKGLPKDIDCALIAGMGGEEIIKILKRESQLSNYLVLQPMKNVDKVRETVVSLGYQITLDEVYFLDKKFYDILVLKKGKDSLTKQEIIFGRTNLQNKSLDFIERLKNQKNTLNSILKNNLSFEDRKEKVELLEEIEKLCLI